MSSKTLPERVSDAEIKAGMEVIRGIAPRTPLAPAVRTSNGLRNALFDEIDALRHGNGDPKRAYAVAQLAKAILVTAKLELQFKQAGLAPNDTITPLPLGDMDG